MKKILLLFVLLAACLCLHGCADQAQEIPTEELPFDSMQNPVTGKVISLGQTQEEVEAILQVDGVSAFGEVSEEDRAAAYFYGPDGDPDTITVGYYDGVADSLALTWNEQDITLSNWQTKYGISKGSTGDEVIAAFGETEKVADSFPSSIEPPIEMVPIYHLTYSYDSNWNRIDDPADAAYQIEIVVDEETDMVRRLFVFVAVGEEAQ